MTKDLIMTECIIMMHYDLNPWANIWVGFDDDKSFVVELQYSKIAQDNYSPDEKYNKWLIVKKVNIEKLADRLHTNILSLPKKIKELHGSTDDKESWSISEVLNSFHSIEAQLERLNIPYTRQQMSYN